jgi:hypothetical protein
LSRQPANIFINALAAAVEFASRMWLIRPQVLEEHAWAAIQILSVRRQSAALDRWEIDQAKISQGLEFFVLRKIRINPKCRD